MKYPFATYQSLEKVLKNKKALEKIVDLLYNIRYSNHTGGKNEKENKVFVYYFNISLYFLY